ATGSRERAPDDRLHEVGRVRCSLRKLSSWREPFTPTLSPQERGEGAHYRRRNNSTQSHHAIMLAFTTSPPPSQSERLHGVRVIQPGASRRLCPWASAPATRTR